MPRPKTKLNAAGAAATARWRVKAKAAKRPEVDAVDTALATAISWYRFIALSKGIERDVQRVTVLEELAVKFLIDHGSDPIHARHAVLRRVRRDVSGRIARTISGT